MLSGTICASCAPEHSAPPELSPKRAAEADPTRGYPGSLLPVTRIDNDFQWRQQVTATWRGEQHRFDAVLAKEGDVLTLIGLGPMNSRGFVIRLHHDQFELTNHTGQELNFEPRWIMLDIQRVFFPWFDSESPSDGERERKLDDELVTERWQDGTLQQRTFRRLDDHPPGVISVRYSGWASGAQAPAKATLNNGWFGYSLTVETLEQQAF